jgi:hypothetical protein
VVVVVVVLVLVVLQPELEHPPLSLMAPVLLLEMPQCL